jgi:hypothetical protein
LFISQARKETSRLEFLAVLFMALSGVWPFVGIAAHFVGDVIVKRIWGEEIKAERDRLLQKFPAAKDAG